MTTADIPLSLDTLRENRRNLGLGLWWVAGLLLLGMYWVTPAIWNRPVLFALVLGAVAVVSAAALTRVQVIRYLGVGLAGLCAVYLVGNSIIQENTEALALAFALVALAAYGLGSWLYLTPVSKPGGEQQEQQLLFQQRSATGIALLGLTALLLVLVLWLGLQRGLAAFPQVSSLVVLLLIVGWAGCSQLLAPDPGRLPDRVVKSLHDNHGAVTVLLLGLGAIALLGSILLLFRFGIATAFGAGLPETLGLLLVGLVFLGAGIYALRQGEKVDLITTRTLLLIGGGAAGLILTLMTGLRAWYWWDAALLREAAAWGRTWWLWLCIYIQLLGMALMFGSLYLAQGDIRANAVLRRLLYGYNTVFTGVLLLETLVLLNIMMYTALPYNLDWTKTHGLYSLSDRSKKTLQSLREPTTVYAIMSLKSDLSHDVQNLLENCRLYTNRLEVKYVSPESDMTTYNELLEYPKLAQARGGFDAEATRGLLIVYGTKEGDRKPPHAFIKQSDLYESNPHPFGGGPRTREFKGEGLLMNELAFLVAAERKLQVYFTQGNGELVLSEDPRLLPIFRCGQLANSLKKRGYEVKSLVWGAPGKKGKLPDAVYTKKEDSDAHEIPKDADVVVIANPDETYAPGQLEALDRYMKDRQGRLVILSSLPVNPNTGQGFDTGLEDWLKKYGVKLGRDYLIRMPTERLPSARLTEARMTAGNNTEIALAFPRTRFQLGFASVGGLGILFPTRTVDRDIAAAPPGSEYQAERLMEVEAENDVVWAETDYKHLLDPNRYLRQLMQTNQLEAKRSGENIPVAVTVTDRSGNKRMVVFGDGSIACDWASKLNYPYYEMLGTSVAWLAGRSTDLGIGPKRYTMYVMKTDDPGRYYRMVFLPLGLVTLTLLGIGTGVWLVRRR